MSIPYSRKRKASCLEIVASIGNIATDVVKHNILPLLHSKFSWDEVMGELTLVCAIVWNRYFEDMIENYNDFTKEIIVYAKMDELYNSYKGLAKLDARHYQFHVKTLREHMENWYFINTTK